jgi:uncharacterized membrane protein YkvA (DUF1232 family)
MAHADERGGIRLGGSGFGVVLGVPFSRKRCDNHAMGNFAKWIRRARKFKLDAHALYLACRDSRTPWYAKAFAALVVGYAFSPIDLIPDPIPLVGHLDDIILVPLGVWVASRMIPADVLAECRQRASASHPKKPRSRWAAAAVVTVWVVVAVLLAYIGYQYF